MRIVVMGMIMLTQSLQSVATFAREVHKLHFCSFHNNWKINLHIPSPAQKNKIEKKSYSKDEKCKIIKQFPVREAKWYLIFKPVSFWQTIWLYA